MNFERAFAEIEVGTIVVVSDGTTEPEFGSSLLRKAWESHNFTAELVAKEESPRCIKFRIETDWGELLPCIVEGGYSDVYTFSRLVPIISDARESKWDEVKIARDFHIEGGCATPLGRIDSDLVSRTNVAGAVSMAQIAMASSTPFSIEWTMEDNSVVIHDGPAMIAAGVAVGTHVNACHRVARSLRDQIEAAQTISEVDSISVGGAPWP